MDQGADGMLYTWNTRHETALHVAAAAGHASCISCLLRSSLVNGANGRVDLAQAVYGEVSVPTGNCIPAQIGRVLIHFVTDRNWKFAESAISLAFAADPLFGGFGILRIIAEHG